MFNCSDSEVALIEALAIRYPDENAQSDFSACDRAYADAMRKVHDRFGHKDFHIITLFADALMMCAPRKLYDTTRGLHITSSRVFEVKALLEKALKMPVIEDHLGPAHMYIYLMEMSSTPQAALPAA